MIQVPSFSLLLFYLINLSNNVNETNAFGIATKQIISRSTTAPLYSSSIPSDVESDDVDSFFIPATDDAEDKSKRDQIKTKLLALFASYDRGFGASPRARSEVEALVKELELMNPKPSDANVGIDGKVVVVGESEQEIPLKGIWRMVWTTALDVLNLAASPIATPGAIYQDISNPPLAINIIDFIPRFQSLLPTSASTTSLVRAEVQTRASRRKNYSDNRVGLTFESVKLIPIEILGFKPPDSFLPPFKIDFPTSLIDVEKLPGVDPENAPGFFDVTYLDEDMLIIKQNAPGGYFVSIKVDNCDP